MGDITWNYEERKVGELVPWERNPREISRDQAKRLLESWEEFGQVEMIAIGPENQVYNGHQRLKVLSAAHGPSFVVKVLVSSRALSEKEREKLTIYLHKGAAGQWDWDALANGFEIEDLLNWGFTEKELLGGGFDLNDAEGEDAGPRFEDKDILAEKWGVKLGQVWQLGAHRLACGDSTDQALNDLLFQGEKAEICWTDPPWNVAYGEGFWGGKSALGWKKRTIINDNLGDKFGEFATGFCKAIYDNLVPGGILYMAMSAQEWGLICDTLTAAEFHWSSTIIWHKDSLVVSRKDYHTQYEPVWYGWKADGPRVCKVDNRKQSDVWDIDRPKKSEEHPTMKPLELVERSLRNSSKHDWLVYDPFMGSGTTLIACTRLDRRCRGIEIDPGYLAIEIQRWVDMTGGEPELINVPEAVA
jgi:DNA modification methylase